jgi:hypothetical protein
MTPREKANELYSKYDDLLNKDFMNPIVFDNQIKQCALIAVDEMTKYNPNIYHNDMVKEKYYNEVKQEIDKL